MARDALALQVKGSPRSRHRWERDWINPRIKNESRKEGLRKQEEDKSGSQESRNPERKAEPIVIPWFPDSFPGFQIRLYPMQSLRMELS
jgi:hypothetical protein